MAKLDKLLEQAKGHLDPGEQVLAAVQGTYETKIMGSDSVRSGILMATQGRIVFYAKKLGGYDLESFAYGNISSFEQSKAMMGHTIAFFASGNKVSMKWINDAAAMQQFVATVRERTNPSSAATIPGTYVARPAGAQASERTAVPQAQTDEKTAIIEAIKQLGELHKTGILSDEEFGTKKAELLARL
jgi:hypothetical protein